MGNMFLFHIDLTDLKNVIRRKSGSLVWMFSICWDYGNVIVGDLVGSIDSDI